MFFLVVNFFQFKGNKIKKGFFWKKFFVNFLMYIVEFLQ